MSQCSLTLLVSDLERHFPEGADWPQLPALQLLLSKGQWEGMPADFSAALFELFPLQVAKDGDEPMASLSALGDGLAASSGWWLRADPVHLVADRDQLYLSACYALGVTQSEADELVKELNRTYAADGWEFVVVTPQRWYLRLPQPLTMRTIPTAGAIGRRVGEVLPQGDDALVFQRAMTEIQMLLHTSQANTRRSEQGLLAINSLWFWGGGELPAAAGESAWDRVVADDPLLLGLARLHGVETATAATTPLSMGAGEEQVLWQVDVTSLEWAERELFAPLVAMLQAGELAELVLVLPGYGRWHIDRAALRRWWRRRKPLAALLQVSG